MTVAVVLGHRAGLITRSHSTARSEPAERLAQLAEDTRMHLLDSYTMRSAAERALNELEKVRDEASFPGWNGYGAKPMHPEAYSNAKLFLEALPTMAPFPEVSADPDGDVALDWSFGPRKALSISISSTGRCTFAWMHGHRTYRGTDWLADEIPSNIAQALWQLAREIAQTRPSS